MFSKNKKQNTDDIKIERATEKTVYLVMTEKDFNKKTTTGYKGYDTPESAVTAAMNPGMGRWDQRQDAMVLNGKILVEAKEVNGNLSNLKNKGPLENFVELVQTVQHGFRR